MAALRYSDSLPCKFPQWGSGPRAKPQSRRALVHFRSFSLALLQSCYANLCVWLDQSANKLGKFLWEWKYTFAWIVFLTLRGQALPLTLQFRCLWSWPVMCSRDCHAVEITIQFINTLKIGQQAFCLLYQMMMMMMLMICSAWCNTWLWQAVDSSPTGVLIPWNVRTWILVCWMWRGLSWLGLGLSKLWYFD